jgi:hypothetical protein
MQWSRASAIGAVAVLALTAACTSEEPAAPDRPGAGAAEPAYEAPAGAPGLCADLAGSTTLADLPEVLGTLSVRPGDETARERLADTVEEFEAVLDGVWEQSAPDDVTAAMEDLAAALYAAARRPVDEEILARVADSLEAVGRRAQPVCGFPA